ncbi:MAG TPA: ABC transporter substrate-binding protein, partial [Ornithinicoccus sp.]|nr:ABC transporter substrate-binding protein [Ornithinicoccus sp.]
MRTNLFKLTAAAGVLALTLTACGSDGDGETDGALAGEGSGDDCVIEGEVPVGAALSLTGAAASYGESQKAGLELAAEALNEKEGVTYKLTIEDDQTDPKQGITVFEGFVGDGTSVIIGPTLSNTAFQSQPIAQEGSTPVLAISNTAAGIT